MKFFVTGAGGFIGSALARELAGSGHDVTGLVRSLAGSVPSASGPGGVRLVEGDVAATTHLPSPARQALAEAEVLVHAAAVRRDWALDDAALHRVNVASGPALLDLMRAPQRVLFVSSVAVHGHPVGGPATEDSPLDPSKRYGASKVQAEAALRSACGARGVPLTIARPGITYGPGDTYGMVANLLRLVARRRFLLVGNGANRVNLLHVTDLAQGLARAATDAAAAGTTLILTGPEAVPMRRLVDETAAAVGQTVPALFVPAVVARLGAAVMETTWRLAGIRSEPFLTKAKVDLLTREDIYDTARARSLIGFAPAISLREGLRSAADWLAAHEGWPGRGASA